MNTTSRNSSTEQGDSMRSRKKKQDISSEIVRLPESKIESLRRQKRKVLALKDGDIKPGMKLSDFS